MPAATVGQSGHHTVTSRGGNDESPMSPMSPGPAEHATRGELGVVPIPDTRCNSAVGAGEPEFEFDRARHPASAGSHGGSAGGQVTRTLADAVPLDRGGGELEITRHGLGAGLGAWTDGDQHDTACLQPGSHLAQHTLGTGRRAGQHDVEDVVSIICIAALIIGPLSYLVVYRAIGRVEIK